MFKTVTKLQIITEVQGDKENINITSTIDLNDIEQIKEINKSRMKNLYKFHKDLLLQSLISNSD